MKTTRMIELRTTMPVSAIKPIIDVAVKNVPRSPGAGRMPISEKGMAATTTDGRFGVGEGLGSVGCSKFEQILLSKAE
jgi:hypothetical protein